MNSHELKAEAMAWLRFGKRLPIICTEVGHWNADVLGLNDKISVEVEVKISRADLRAEFRNKSGKHYYYQNMNGGTGPNYFYLMVPENMADLTVELAGAQDTRYGVAIYCPGPELPGKRTKIVHKAAKLHDQPPSAKTIKTALARMGSDLCGMYAHEHDSYVRLFQKLEEVKRDIINVALRTTGTLDIENIQEDIEQRARELAYCVDGINREEYDSLPEDCKNRWKDAVLRMSGLQHEGWSEIVGKINGL